MSIQNYPYDEPSLIKARFKKSNGNIYELEFEDNIQMKDLKVMIKKAAHMRDTTFRLFYNGDEYTQYEEEEFRSLFSNELEFPFDIKETLEQNNNDSPELTIKTNSNCPYHAKILLYYCFTCQTSICSECLNNLSHNSHQIKDKSFYLNTSKVLAKKMFQDVSKNPYIDYKIEEDLHEFNKNFDAKFKNIFAFLESIQEKCNLLIEEYNNINRNSLENIRVSARSIENATAKVLDNLKDRINIKNIVADEDVFLNFDAIYCSISKNENNKFQKNLKSYRDLNKNGSFLVKEFLEKLYASISKALTDCLNEQEFENIKLKLNKMYVKPYDLKAINNYINDGQKKRQTFSKSDNIFFSKNNVKVINNNRNTIHGKNNTSIDNFFVKDFNPKDNDFIQKERPNEPIISANLNNSKFNFTSMSKSNIDSQAINPFLTFAKKYKESNNSIFFKKENNNFSNLLEKDNSNMAINFGQNYNNSLPKNRIEKSQQKEKNISQNIDIGVFNNACLNPFVDAKDTKNTFNNESFCSNIFGNNNCVNANKENFSSIKSNILSCPNDLKEQNNKCNNENNINLNFNNDGILMGKNLINTVPEEKANKIKEIGPSELQLYLKKEFILSPITTSYYVKIITSKIGEERIVKLKFPLNYRFQTFHIKGSHCFCTKNKCLYISGGIEPNLTQNKSNILLCVDLFKSDENKVSIKAPMIYPRYQHTMIYDKKYIYAVGGVDSNSVERYNMEADYWENLSPMNYKRIYPILYIYKDYLYAFFGKNETFKEYPISIERLNINYSGENNRHLWETIELNNPRNIDLRYYGCAVYSIDGLLYFFGGRCNEKYSNKIFFYNFETRLIDENYTQTFWKDCFVENRLYKLNSTLVQSSETFDFGVHINLHN